MYLSVDGGGSKLAAIVYDEELRLVCEARSGGVNPTQNTLETVRAHVIECAQQLEKHVKHIKEADEVFVGGKELFWEELRKRVSVDSIRPISEPVGGLLAGACRKDGLLALSGTGSDVFVIRDGKVAGSVGGWGPVMGDQGSGAWIGLQALRAVARQLNGWGEKTILTELISERLRMPNGKFPPENVVKSPAPYAMAASLVPLVGKAAADGDKVALTIFARAGEAIGRQLEALLKRFGPVDETEIVLCGGAWKAHPSMLDSCQEYMRRIDSRFTLKRPCFEQVLAGPALRLLDQGMSETEAKHVLADRFPRYIINAGGIYG